MKKKELKERNKIELEESRRRENNKKKKRRREDKERY
jgi:hypothetical protein